MSWVYYVAVFVAGMAAGWGVSEMLLNTDLRRRVGIAKVYGAVNEITKPVNLNPGRGGLSQVSCIYADLVNSDGKKEFDDVSRVFSFTVRNLKIFKIICTSFNNTVIINFGFHFIFSSGAWGGIAVATIVSEAAILPESIDSGNRKNERLLNSL